MSDPYRSILTPTQFDDPREEGICSLKPSSGMNSIGPSMYVFDVGL